MAGAQSCDQEQFVTKILGDARERSRAIRQIGPAMRTPGEASLGTRPQRFLDNGLDRSRTTAALGAATETSVDLLGIAGKVFRSTDRVADVVIGQHVAGTNDHEKGGPVALRLVVLSSSILKTMTGCKRKNRVLKLFQTAIAKSRTALKCFSHRHKRI